jgi:transposase
MGRRLEVAEHLSVEALGSRYRGCRDAVEKVHWQVVWLKASGEPTGEIARVTGYQPDWVRRIVRRYNAEGPWSLGDRRQHNGREPLLDEAQQAELVEALSGPAPDGGLWNSPKVASWLSERVGRPVGYQRGWQYLRRLGFTIQQPRPRHVEASEEEQEAFKKNCAVS